MMNNPLIMFIIETVNRLASKSPKYFAIWQWFFGLLTSLTGLPPLLRMVKIVHTLPPVLNALCNADIAFASLGAMAAMFLSTQSKPVKVTTEGAILKQTDAQALPFTAMHETRIATKEGNNETIQ